MVIQYLKSTTTIIILFVEAPFSFVSFFMILAILFLLGLTFYFWKKVNLFKHSIGQYQKKLDKTKAINRILLSKFEERRAIERQLSEAKVKAEQANQLKNKFLENMSHELRTPMNAILGFGNILKSQIRDINKISIYVDIIQKSSENLLSLISNLVDISKIQTNQLVVRKEKLNLNEFLRNEFEILKTKIKIENKDIDILLHIDVSDNDAWAVIDEAKLKQILNNFIENAIKYTETGYIKIGYEIKDKKSVSIYVKDSGIGISPEKQKFIFDNFNKVESEQQLFRGLGLGLSICKGLTDLIGGKISMESYPKLGSSFYIVFPISIFYKSRVLDRKEHVSFLHEKNILVADKNIEQFQLMQKSLNSSNIYITYTKNGSDTIIECTTNPNIDLVIINLNLPEIEGAEVIKRIKSKKPKLPIIAISDYHEAKEELKAIRSGSDDYLMKPLEKEVLLKKISFLITDKVSYN